MLRLELFKNEIKIFIRKKTEGKIRFKRFNQYGLGEQIKQEDINLKENNQYIEWLITYNIEASKNDFDPNWLISECTYKDIKGKKDVLTNYQKFFLNSNEKIGLQAKIYKILLMKFKNIHSF